MTARRLGALSGVSAALTLLAIVAAHDEAVALSLATAAVFAAALAIADAFYRTRPRSSGAPSTQPGPRSGIRDWMASGEMGREDLVLLLDRLERTTLNPALPARTPREIGAIVELRAQDFRDYLDRRLETLEGTV